MQEKLRRKATNSLLAFTQSTFPQFRTGWFQADLCEKLDKSVDDILHRRRVRMMISAPPQHGKSELVSRRLVPYLLGRNPDLAIIAVSYTAELAERFSDDVQVIMDSPEYHAIFPGTTIVGEYAKAGSATRQRGYFQVVGRRGSYRACGIGGSITGMGADVVIVDDTIKDFAEAMSPARRDAIFDWYCSTLYTRLSEGGAVIVIGTRWHPADLIGRLVLHEQQGVGDVWQQALYAAIAEQDEQYRKVGEALCPERHSLQDLTQIQRVVGSYKWNALYQQRPVAFEGAIIKRDWVKYYDVMPSHFDEILQSWDATFKGGPNSDFVSGQVWGRIGSQFFLLDRVRGQWGFPETVEAIKRVSRVWPNANAKLIEEAANGPAIIQYLSSEIAGLIPVRPESTKESRAQAIAPFLEAGNVFLPSPSIAPWVAEYVDELTAFPRGAHDDDVDATTQALLRFQSQEFTPFLFGERTDQTGVHPTAAEKESAIFEKSFRGEQLTAEEIDFMCFEREGA